MTAPAQQWFSAAEIAALGLPGLPTTPANVRALVTRERWDRPEYAGKRWRFRAGRGGGAEFHWSLFPPAARVMWSAAHLTVDEAAERMRAAPCGAHAEAWEAFFRLPAKARAEAARRLQALEMVESLRVETGRAAELVMIDVATAFEVTPSTLYSWRGMVAGRPRAEWLPLLAPRHRGRVKTAACSDDAWNALYALYARPGAPRFSDCYRQIKRLAAEKGWEMPSQATLWRRMSKVPPETLALARQGKDALKRLIPALERDKSVFHALQAVNADGHKWDVLVRWPDGYVGRPMMVGFQDIYSGMFLSWRLDRSENMHLVQRAFGDMVEAYGIPELCYLDNGRGFTAKALTGGIRNRFRYRYRDEEPDGVMKALGVAVHWTQPYSGQSKPIERGFGDLAATIAKDIRFEGAYVGNRPDRKPDNLDRERAVPLDLFIQVVSEGIREHNERPGRRSAVCEGRLSFRQAFEASYRNSIIRKASPAQRPLWLLAAENIKPRAPDGCIHFYDNRYHAPFLTALIGKPVCVRFDPDKLQQPILVFDGAGKLLGEAQCLAPVGFNDVEAARLQAETRRKILRASREIDALHRGAMTRQRLIEELAATETPEPPPVETKVVRLVRGNTALASESLMHARAQREAETEELFERAMANRPRPVLRLVEEEAGGD